MNILEIMGLQPKKSIIHSSPIVFKKKKKISAKFLHGLPWSYIIKNPLVLRNPRFRRYIDIDLNSTETELSQICLTNYISFDYERYCDTSRLPKKSTLNRQKRSSCGNLIII